MSKLTLTQLRVLRGALAGSIVLAIVLSVAFKGDMGTLCAYCPVGLAQVAVASGSVAPMLIYSILGVIALGLLFGRGFCGWACPTSLLGKGTAKGPAAGARKTSGTATRPIYSLGLVGAVLLVSLFVGFPVFCIVCPVGLVFGFLFAVIKAFTTYQATWDLLIIPLMLLLEFKVLRSWCRLFCPMGALMAFLGALSPIRIRKKVNKEKCRAGEGCQGCEQVCPEGIAVRGIVQSADPNCTLCGSCLIQCPHQAISLRSPAPGLPERQEDAEEVTA